MELCEERPDDWHEVEALMDLCFAPGRTALSSYRLREDVEPVADLCLLLRQRGTLRAAIRYWPVRVGGRPALLLGPVAVHPTAQGEGLGGLLMRESLARARALGWQRVMLVGDAPYYSRFGFARLDGVEMPPPTNPDRVLGLELVPGAWVDVTGQVTRAPGIATAPPADPEPGPACTEIDPAEGSAKETPHGQA
ncbi:GNAT family N-acetyltransferase [Paracoccus jeotgali]|uniref:GNAT family N-acetyltransferase n=1 Tax=Paracoccus jeotgali TaxID=2065379 RepID=UPI0028AD92A7|nr:N-acetyltransferase [Paracoccus jeotgali]